MRLTLRLGRTVAHENGESVIDPKSRFFVPSSRRQAQGVPRTRSVQWSEKSNAGASSRGQRGFLAIREARASQSKLSLLIIDVDEFNTVNNRFGHPAGDRVLRKIADLLRVTIRE